MIILMDGLIDVTSHKDVEKIINTLEGFRLYEHFMTEGGLCYMGGEPPPRRNSLEDPHIPSGQIYRPIWDNQFNNLGFVKYDGETRLSVHFKDGMRNPAELEHVVKNYCFFKNNLTARMRMNIIP